MRREVVLVLITLALFVDMLTYDIVVPFLPMCLRDWDTSRSLAGVFFSSYSVALLLATPLFGRLADRIGRKPVILWGSFGLAGATLLYGFASGFPALLAARLLQGTAGAALWTAGLAFIADIYPPQRRGQAMGTAVSGMALGTLIGPALGGVLYDLGGLRLPFLVTGSLALAVGVALVVVLPKLAPVRRPVMPWRVQLADPELLACLGVVVLGATVLSLLEPTLPLHLTERLHVGPTAIGLLFSVATIAYGICSPIAGALSDRYGRRRTLAAGMVATCLVLPLIALPHDWLGELGSLLPLGAACAFQLAPTLPELADLSDRRGGSAYGASYALFNMAYAIGMVVGPALGVFLQERLAYSAALSVVGIVFLLFVPVFLALTQRRAAYLVIPKPAPWGPVAAVRPPGGRLG